MLFRSVGKKGRNAKEEKRVKRNQVKKTVKCFVDDYSPVAQSKHGIKGHFVGQLDFDQALVECVSY